VNTSCPDDRSRGETHFFPRGDNFTVLKAGLNCITWQRLGYLWRYRMAFVLDGRGSIHGRSKRFFSALVSRQAVGLIQPPIQWGWVALSSGVKRPRREVDHRCPSSAEVNNGGVIPPLTMTAN
jgi:hypothetical protein